MAHDIVNPNGVGVVLVVGLSPADHYLALSSKPIIVPHANNLAVYSQVNWLPAEQERRPSCKGWMEESYRSGHMVQTGGRHRAV
jgi:hypothetical protein